MRLRVFRATYRSPRQKKTSHLEPKVWFPIATLYAPNSSRFEAKSTKDVPSSVTQTASQCHLFPALQVPPLMSSLTRRGFGLWHSLLFSHGALQTLDHVGHILSN